MPENGIICFGDSNTYGFDPRSFIGDRYEAENRWCDILSKKLKCRVLNLGLNGRCVPEGSTDFLNKTIEENPDCGRIIIMLGTNDILKGQTPEETARKMKKLIEELRARTEARIILISPFKTNLDAELDERIIKLSELYKSLADSCKCIFLEGSQLNIELCFDGVHMTEKANRDFAEILSEFLEKI